MSPCPENAHSGAARAIGRARRALEQGKLDKAERLCGEIVRHRPHDVDALHLLGMLNYQRGQLAEALALLRTAVAIDDRRADMWSDLGLILLAFARFDEALAAYDRAYGIAPDDLDALNGRGVALLGLDRTVEAIASYDRVLALDPAHIDALGNRGNALLKLNRLHGAIASYEAALKMAPRHARLLTNHAVALRWLDRPHEALMGLTRALVSSPDFAEARFVQALVKLTLGDFRAGWKGYESRWATAAFAPHRRNFAPPLWLGDQPLAGKTILLHGEQGYGDVIQFVRYAPRVAALGATVILEVQPELVRLLARVTGVAAIVAHGKPLPAFDCHCPIMSLPLAFGTELATIPADIPYLAANVDDIAAWRERLPRSRPVGRRRPLVGVAWAGNITHKSDLSRSMRLATLRPLLELPNVQFVNLQHDMRAQDADARRNCPQLKEVGARFADFAETAAVIAQLDAVISVDTAVAHLTGAMGKPLLLLLPFAADFRWLRDRRDSPWYPTARLFRQRELDNWDGAVDELRNELIRIGECGAIASAALPLRERSA
jgi:tetratricopeptide (TPR) repeat protein